MAGGRLIQNLAAGMIFLRQKVVIISLRDYPLSFRDLIFPDKFLYTPDNILEILCALQGDLQQGIGYSGEMTVAVDKSRHQSMTFQIPELAAGVNLTFQLFQRTGGRDQTVADQNGLGWLCLGGSPGGIWIGALGGKGNCRNCCN